MKDYLKNFIETKRAEAVELQKRSDESEDIKEVRAIGETLKKLADEIKDAQAQLEKLEEEKPAEAEEETAERAVVPANAELRNATVVATFGGKTSMENMAYRNAFMEFVLRGTAIPTELRENTLTSDVAGVIPTHLVNQIVEKMDAVGSVINLITKTAYSAGVSIPVSTVKPVAVWVAEGAGSNRQKKSTGSVVFTYHKLRCEISMSMEVGTMALSAFEAKFVENVAKAMIKAIESAIINGTGEGQPKGILTSEVPAGQALTATAISYEKLCEAEGVLPEAYEAGAKWCMNKKTFALVQGMVDQNGQPIARVNYGISGKPERMINGREVVVCADVAEGVLFMYDFADYILNTIYDMGITKKQDWDTEDLLTKAVMSVDGKPVDLGSLVKLTVGI